MSATPSALALRRLARHAARLLAEHPPIPPTSYADAPKYAQAVAAQVLAQQVLNYVAEIVVDDTREEG